jgi:dipeptidase E
MKKLLLISNSTNAGEEYLGWPRPHISSFLQQYNVRDVLFIPYAGVGLAPEDIGASYDSYETRVRVVFNELGHEIHSIHKEKDPVGAVNSAEAIAVGGGNTFYLVYMLYKTGIVEVIRKKALGGAPYLGWSAGANVACPTLRTTNDMPIIQPESFRCFDLVPFQINPHYLDANPEGHGGETRQQRIEEFLTVNRGDTVVGLREGTLLQVEGRNIELKGKRPMRLFRFGSGPIEYLPGEDIGFLME